MKRYLPTGETRAVWDDSQAARERAQGVIPRRASRVEVVESGPNLGRFHVDFSPLAAATGDPAHLVCLPRTFGGYSEAVEAEVAWLHENYVRARV